MGLKSLLTTLALSAFALGMNAQTGSLSFGDYDSVSEWDDYDESSAYDGSAPDYAPFNCYYVNSGCQTILLKDEVSSLAGKNITSLGIKMFDIGVYDEYNVSIKVYLTETSASTYEISDSKKLFFNTNDATLLYDNNIVYDGLTTYGYYFHNEFVLMFDKPFYYSGKNNLVVTIIASSDATTDKGYINTYYVDDMKNRTLTCCSDTKRFDELLAGDRNSATKGYSCGLINAPMMAINYELNTKAPDATYKTFVTSCDVDFTAIKGIEAYKVASVGSNSLQLEAIESAKAGTPVILKTNIQPSFTTGTATAVSDNMLLASDGTVTSDGTFYCLATKNGVQAFYPVTSGVKIPKGKAYIQIAGGAAKMNIALDDVTAISTTTTTQKSDAVYNLQGQRTEAAKGIFIVGGKKVIKK